MRGVVKKFDKSVLKKSGYLIPEGLKHARTLVRQLNFSIQKLPVCQIEKKSV